MCTWTDPNHNKQVRIQRRNIVMNKAELIAAMSEKAELSRKDAEKALKAFTDVVTEELQKGEKIQLVGFGTFEVSERAARTGRNPQSGAEMVIPASKAPKFKAGKALKDMINA
ncbi:HU family DNA-binding protein [Lachnospiraceae bacterium KK002]